MGEVPPKKKGSQVQAPDRFTMAYSTEKYFLLFCSAAYCSLNDPLNFVSLSERNGAQRSF